MAPRIPACRRIIQCVKLGCAWASAVIPRLTLELLPQG
jgi:hypothetical protein